LIFLDALRVELAALILALLRSVGETGSAMAALT
jgi:hypothetical protein